MRRYNQKKYAKVRERIHDYRNSDSKSFEINSKVSKAVIKHLGKQGDFYHDDYRTFFFSQDDKKLIPIEPESNECALLLAQYGLNKAERIYQYLVQSLWTEAITNGTEITVHRLSCYDPDAFKLYMYNHNNQVYRISPEKIELVDNGADGKLFISDPNTQPFEITKPDGSCSRLDEVLLSKINPGSTVLNPDETRLAIRLWFYSLFFKEIMPTKAILLFLGPKGSGKTIIARKIGMILFGRKFDVTPLTRDSKDFDAAITNSPYVAIDNADTAPKWFQDGLAITATGGTIKKRMYYKTNEEVDFPVQCYAAITSRTPNFSRDDIADRLMVIELERFDKFVPENLLLNKLLKHRNEIMSEVVYSLQGVLQGVLRAFKGSQNEDSQVSLRMADFADLCLKIADAENKHKEVVSLLAKLEYLQRVFHLESDPLGKLLYIWAEKNSQREVFASALNQELAHLAQQKGIDYPYKDNPRSFAQKLKSLQVNFSDMLHIHVRPAHGGKNKYKICPKLPHISRGGGKGGF